MKGDAYLRLILTDYFLKADPSISQEQLEQNCQAYSNNEFLRTNYIRLDQESSQ